MIKITIEFDPFNVENIKATIEAGELLVNAANTLFTELPNNINNIHNVIQEITKSSNNEENEDSRCPDKVEDKDIIFTTNEVDYQSSQGGMSN